MERNIPYRKVTVGIPLYNDERFIGDVIRSVLNQSFGDFNIVIADDGSRDRSIEIVESFDDPRIILLKDGQNRGVSYRRNQLTAYANSDYLALIDSDDIMHPHRLEIQLRIMEDNPEVDILCSNAYVIDENNNIKGFVFPDTGAGEPEDIKWMLQPCTIAKTKFFKDNPYVDIARVEDGELWHRTYPKYIFRKTNEPLIFYRVIKDGYYRKYRKGLKSYFHLGNRHFKYRDYPEFLYWYKRGSKFFCKFLAYEIFHLFGSEQILLDRRYRKPTPEEIAEGNKILREAIK